MLTLIKESSPWEKDGADHDAKIQGRKSHNYEIRSIILGGFLLAPTV